tara:strand:+ start:231 stop:383 length:153 start_codon:yes stop_codon:yes gene_type:complete
MVDITDLKSVGLRPWEFKSPRPHHSLIKNAAKSLIPPPPETAAKKMDVFG